MIETNVRLPELVLGLVVLNHMEIYSFAPI
jgi:hypothetical protein